MSCGWWPGGGATARGAAAAGAAATAGAGGWREYPGLWRQEGQQVEQYIYTCLSIFKRKVPCLEIQKVQKTGFRVDVLVYSNIEIEV